jgi:hypothetical protein
MPPAGRRGSMTVVPFFLAVAVALRVAPEVMLAAAALLLLLLAGSRQCLVFITDGNDTYHYYYCCCRCCLRSLHCCRRSYSHCCWRYPHYCCCLAASQTHPKHHSYPQRLARPARPGTAAKELRRLGSASWRPCLAVGTTSLLTTTTTIEAPGMRDEERAW